MTAAKTSQTASRLAKDGGEPIRTKPFPPRKQFDRNEVREVTQAIRSGNLFGPDGTKVYTLEEQFAKAHDMTHCVATSSGTAAVHTALAALDLEPGSEVITCPVTDMGTINGMFYHGLIPIFADWKPDTLTVDPQDIERRVTSKTRAIVVVHLCGNPCDMDAIMDIARRHKLRVIEDCCQAYFAKYKSKLVGTIGEIGCFSLQQSKHMAAGEGGLAITNNKDLAARMQLFRDKGWGNRGSTGAREYLILGLNYRMTELVAAVGIAQLAKVRNFVEKRRKLGDLLRKLTSDIPGIISPITDGAEHAYWMYPFKVVNRSAEQFVAAMRAEGITQIGFGYTKVPIYLCARELFINRNTFGKTGYPFDERFFGNTVKYDKGLCPVAESDLLNMGHIHLHEGWSERDIRDVAKAMRKVATLL